MYILEGNIGSGKSTLLRLIERYMSYITIAQEPVEAWSSAALQDSLLGQFCADMKRWSYSMETYTLFVRVTEHLRLQEKLFHEKSALTLVERSLYSGRYCFAKNGYLQGNMTELEWKLYIQAFDFLVHAKCTPPTGFIYLQTDPQTCYERTQKRNRPGEESIPLSYFEELHARHEDFFVDRNEALCTTIKNIPVLVLQGHGEFENDMRRLSEMLDKIDEFIFMTSDPRGIAQSKAGFTTAQRCCGQ